MMKDNNTKNKDIIIIWQRKRITNWQTEIKRF